MRGGRGWISGKSLGGGPDFYKNPIWRIKKERNLSTMHLNYGIKDCDCVCQFIFSCFLCQLWQRLWRCMLNYAISGQHLVCLFCFWFTPANLYIGECVSTLREISGISSVLGGNFWFQAFIKHSFDKKEKKKNNFSVLELSHNWCPLCGQAYCVWSLHLRYL